MQEQIKKLIEEELERANAKFPPFNSAHEGWAVILEEYEEAKEELESMEYALGMLWRATKRNSEHAPHIDEIYRRAITLASEAIQVGAMAVKMSQLLKKEESSK